MDWSEQIGDMIQAAKQSFRYELFGSGGTGARDFSYFSFGKFEAFGYEFVPYMIDAFDNRRYGNILEYFCVLMPNAKFKDQQGIKGEREKGKEGKGRGKGKGGAISREEDLYERSTT